MSNQQTEPTKLDPNMALDEEQEKNLTWHSPMNSPFQLVGFPWLTLDGKYRRLPISPSYPLPPAVDSLANCTAGGQIRFRTDSRKLSLRVKLRGVANMYHMPATGQCGFDCYLGELGNQLYCSTTRYNHREPEYECVMFEMEDRQTREVTLYFPLYQGVEEVLIGTEPDAMIDSPTPLQSDRPVVVYGTSITQGGCAARSGMAYTNILSRRFPLEFINLGFSGNGKGEAELAHIISEISDPACFVLDYEANSGEPDALRATLPEFIRILREAHPHVPILVLSRIRYSNEHFYAKRQAMTAERKQIQIDTVERWRAQGDEQIFFHDGSDLLGDDFHECTVDGSHPTDFGFFKMAESLTPVFAQLLGMQAHTPTVR